MNETFYLYIWGVNAMDKRGKNEENSVLLLFDE